MGLHHLRARPLEHAGAEVLGFDIREPLANAIKEELRALWNERAILVFRGQDVNPSRLLPTE